MCVSPIRVNIKRDGNLSSTLRHIYEVPCGKCWQCRLTKSNNYLVRASFEFERVTQSGGCALFLTLTYNDDNLPLIANRIPCFNRDDVTKYFKRVRKRCCDYLKKHGYNKDDVAKLVTGNIKYLLTSEYGDHTHRPHYHILWFCSSMFPKWIFRKIISDSWKLGFTKFGSENNGFVTDMRGIKYVTKYIGKNFLASSYYNKQIDWFENEIKKCNRWFIDNDIDIKISNFKFSDVFGKKVSDMVERSRWLNESYSQLKKDKPFTASSRYLGMFAVDLKKINENVLRAGFIDVYGKQYALPDYYKRKLLYDVTFEKVDDVRCKNKYRVKFTLNELGDTLRQENYLFHMRRFSDRLISSICFINSKIYDAFPDFTSDSIRSKLANLTDNYSERFLKYAFFYSHYMHIADLVPSNLYGIDSSDIEEMVYLTKVERGLEPPLDTEVELVSSSDDISLFLSSFCRNIIAHYKPEYDLALNVINLNQYFNYQDSIIEQNKIDSISADNKLMNGIVK